MINIGIYVSTLRSDSLSDEFRTHLNAFELGNKRVSKHFITVKPFEGILTEQSRNEVFEAS
jgi:hypothetical protein